MHVIEATPQPWCTENRILACLPEKTLQALIPLLERVRLERGDVLESIGTPIKNIYFVERGMISLARPMRDGRYVEIHAIGPEGVAPSMIGLGNSAFTDAIVEVSGAALRLAYPAFRAIARRENELRRALRRYASEAWDNVAQTAACNALHTVEQRCCRWLLTVSDKTGSAVLPLTHESLAAMLGVRRASVSIAAAALQEAQLIRYSHGKIVILDRAALERTTCECYSALRTLNRSYGVVQTAAPQPTAL